MKFLNIKNTWDDKKNKKGEASAEAFPLQKKRG